CCVKIIGVEVTSTEEMSVLAGASLQRIGCLPATAPAGDQRPLWPRQPHRIGTRGRRHPDRDKRGSLAVLLPLLPLVRRPTRAVALLLSVSLEATFARLLAPGRVSHGVVVVALDLLAPRRLIRTSSPGFDRFLWRLGRDETIATSPDQILP